MLHWESCDSEPALRMLVSQQQQKDRLFVGEYGLDGLTCEKYNYDSMRLAGEGYASYAHYEPYTPYATYAPYAPYDHASHAP